MQCIYIRIRCHHLATLALWQHCWGEFAKWLAKDWRQACQQLPHWATQFCGEPGHAGDPQESGTPSGIPLLDWRPRFDFAEQRHRSQSLAEWRGSSTSPGERAAWCGNGLCFDPIGCFPKLKYRSGNSTCHLASLGFATVICGNDKRFCHHNTQWPYRRKSSSCQVRTLCPMMGDGILPISKKRRNGWEAKVWSNQSWVTYLEPPSFNLCSHLLSIESIPQRSFSMCSSSLGIAKKGSQNKTSNYKQVGCITGPMGHMWWYVYIEIIEKGIYP